MVDAEQVTRYQTVANELKLVKTGTHGREGIALNEHEEQFLLNHFMMIIVGMPGSGKSTVIKQLLLNKQMYNQKFDYIFLVSPSHAKMGLSIKKERCAATFNLQWVFQQIQVVNDRQFLMASHVLGEKKGLLGAHGKGVGFHMGTFVHGHGIEPSKPGATLQMSRSKFFNEDTLGVLAGNKPRDKSAAAPQKPDSEYLHRQMKKMSEQQKQSFYKNVLFVFDDVVGDIKRAENDPQLASLIMNRRHLVHNGMISLMLVTQKYSLIPARLRSNCNWLILFQLNPLDMQRVYEDVVRYSRQKWEEIVEYAFEERQPKSTGANGSGRRRRVTKYGEKQMARDDRAGDQGQVVAAQEEGGTAHEKISQKTLTAQRGKNLGIWVEFNMYFKNFQRIACNQL